MRLHHLQITAFGPFADTVSVDFDALTEASVFLLCGEIGAGKTMVLDAVCFALYGDVPSERGRAKQLRSHFAADGAEPRVVLEATLGARRLRFTRSPAWTRPKKRGTGTTTAQPSVLVQELVKGSWVTRCTRLDDAGHLVGELLGMTLGQFSQVVLLPQGRFDTFLRATSEERHALLSRLFRTSRFEDAERWLAERRTSLRRADEARAGEVGTLLHRMSETSGADLPGDLLGDLQQDVDESRVASWADGLISGTELEAAGAAAALHEATDRLTAAVEADAEGIRVADLVGRHRRATARAAFLEATGEQCRLDRDRLAAARRAAIVAGPRRAHDTARCALTDADDEAARSLVAVADLLEDDGEPDPGSLDQHVRRATRRAAAATALLPRARELVAQQRRHTELDRRVESVEEQRRTLAATVASAPAEIAGLEHAVTALRERAGRVDLLKVRLAEGGRRLSRYATFTELEFQVADFSAKRDAQRAVTVDLRSRLLDVREQRLHGMAAELASAMAVGASCPVCGSHEHPDPATPSPDAPDGDEEQRLQSEVDDAEVLLETHQDQVRGYSARLAELTTELGGVSQADAEAAVAVAQEELAVAQTASAELREREQELDRARAGQQQREAGLATLTADLAVAREQLTSCTDAVASLGEEIAALLGGPAAGRPPEDLPAAVAVLAEDGAHAADLLAAARDALVERGRRRQLVDDAYEALVRAADEQGFADGGSAAASELTTAELSALEGQVAERERAEAEVAATLADPDVAGAGDLAEPDLEALTTARRLATEAHAAATAADHAVRARQERLVVQRGRLDAILERWLPERAEYAVVRSLSELAEGKGPDNPRQIRLSAYVLSARLGQVVAAANERLARMTDDRYLLEHTAERGVGERRGGLSLLVRDQWTDDLRDPVTLSGGETFVVSLALALGLSDVVTAEAGGARVDTLFVDEGFGSLDADTLELVMDTLDQLREGGRAVGVVSHVPELRARIPAQLVVHKTRAGSSLSQGGPGR